MDPHGIPWEDWASFSSPVADRDYVMEKLAEDIIQPFYAVEADINPSLCQGAHGERVDAGWLRACAEYLQVTAGLVL